MGPSPGEIVLGLYRVWQEKGVDAAVEHVSPDIEWIEPEETIGAEARRGREDALAGYRNWAEMYEDWGGEITGVEEHGERVLVHFMQRGLPRGGSVAVEEPIYNLWTVRDGLAVRMQMFLELEQARAALYDS